jgi:hypothetical protein
MIRDFDYQRRADECGTWSENAATPVTRELWRQMESFWRDRARRAGAYRSPKDVASSLGRQGTTARLTNQPFSKR